MLISLKKVVQLDQEENTLKAGANNDQANGAGHEGTPRNNTRSENTQGTIREEPNTNTSRGAGDKGLAGNLEGTTSENDSTLQEVGSAEGLRNDENSGSRSSVSKEPASGNVLDGRKGTSGSVSNGEVGTGGRGRNAGNDIESNAEGESVSVSRPNGRGSNGSSEGIAKSTSTVNGNYHIDDIDALIDGTMKRAFLT